MFFLCVHIVHNVILNASTGCAPERAAALCHQRNRDQRQLCLGLPRPRPLFDSAACSALFMHAMLFESAAVIAARPIGFVRVCVADCGAPSFWASTFYWTSMESLIFPARLCLLQMLAARRVLLVVALATTQLALSASIKFKDSRVFMCGSLVCEFGWLSGSLCP